jgi:hypothetical protein
MTDMENKAEEKKTFGIMFGALAEPIAKQIKSQHLKYDPEKCKHFEKLKQSLLCLHFADLLPDAQYEKSRAKLYKQIEKHVMQKNKLHIAK